MKTLDGPKDQSNDPADHFDGTDRFHSLLCIGCDRWNDCFVIYRPFTIQEQMFHSLIYQRSKRSIRSISLRWQER